MSSRHTRASFGVLIAVVFALSAIIAAPASAKLSKSQKAHVRHQLRKQIKKHPRLIRSKHFVKKASLVNFKLPVTIALRGSNAATNPNAANIDLGSSLGQREIDLGGKLAAEIVFHDSFDGGALGNVDLDILPSATKNLTSTSVPLLWNSQVTQPGSRWDANLLGLPSAFAGCSNFTGSAALPFGADNVTPPIPILGPAGLIGVPFVDPAVSVSTPTGFLPVKPGVDDITNVTASKIPGNNNNIGGNVTPFPSGSTPGGFTQPPSAQDSVLRTNALNLTIAQAGTNVNQSTNADGVAGGQDITIGKSGGQANLFGNIPGKAYGIDVTVNLATKIYSIFRIVDQDSFQSPLVTGAEYPAGIFGCRQIWSGGVQNYIPSVHLVGGLKIAPGITSDGHLRIAKATIKTPNTGTVTADKARVSLAACLAPWGSYANPQNASDTAASAIPSATLPPPTLTPDAQLPGDSTTPRGTPPSSVNCNDTPTRLVQDSALNPATVQSLLPASGANGYTVSNSGSTAVVAGDLDVKNVSVDVLIGDV